MPHENVHDTLRTLWSESGFEPFSSRVWISFALSICDEVEKDQREAMRMCTVDREHTS